MCRIFFDRMGCAVRRWSGNIDDAYRTVCERPAEAVRVGAGIFYVTLDSDVSWCLDMQMSQGEACGAGGERTPEEEGAQAWQPVRSLDMRGRMRTLILLLVSACGPKVATTPAPAGRAHRSAPERVLETVSPDVWVARAGSHHRQPRCASRR